MNNRLPLILFSACVVFSAQAQDSGNPAPNADFVKLDLNKDKFLSRAEAAADKDLAAIFSKADLNKDGKLDEDEYLKGVNLYRSEKTKQFAGDSTLTTKVKAALFGASGVPSTAISVETVKGRVTLTGKLDNKDQIAEALKATKAVAGVTAIQNNLKVK